MPQMDVDGVRLHYQLSAGPSAAAPVLMLSNSLGTDLNMWNAQLPGFERHFRVLRYDTRGHGASAVGPAPTSIERLGQDALALLDALGLEQVLFCGLSLGGMTGMWLATHQARRIGRLALCNTAARIAPRDLWDARIKAVSAGGMAAITDAVLDRWLTPQFRATSPREVDGVRNTLLATPATGYINCCEAIRDMDQRDSVAGITAPTIVLSGTHDVATPPADGQFLAGRIRGARYVELPTAHLSNIEAATRFTDVVAGFLARQAH